MEGDEELVHDVRGKSHDRILSRVPPSCIRHCPPSAPALAPYLSTPRLPPPHPPQVKGLDVDNLVISHVQVNKAMRQRRRTYR